MLELTTNLLAEIGGWPALKEARLLVERGKVRDARQEGALIRATVQGAEKTHTPQITLADRIANIEVRCTCAENRRTGRVCPHALAAGFALLHPVVPAGPRGGAVASSRDSNSPSSVSKVTGSHLPKRFLVEDAPPHTPLLELTLLLPLQLKEALAKNPVRIILEARREADPTSQPFETILRTVTAGFALSEADDRLLTALEKLTGAAAGINAIPCPKISALFPALDAHPRIWLGKKQRIDVKAATERPQITLGTRADGTLELSCLTPGDKAAANAARLRGGPSHGAQPVELPIPNWRLIENQLIEFATLPPGFSSHLRLIPAAQIPDFLSREFPTLERTCELSFAPGFAEFQMEIATPEIEARLDGALSGLTLDLVARYGDQTFPLTGKTEPGAYQRYSPDLRQANRFWRRNVLAERSALALAEAAGFKLVRNDAATFSLIQENHVARFLANTLPRWRQKWRVTYSSRLEETMKSVDIAQPEFALRSGSGEDWLSLDLKLSVQGQPVALDPAEIQRWLQTGQTHTRTANKRVLLVPTEAWSEMQEALADCEVVQEPGEKKIRVAPTFAPYLAGALTAQGFHSRENDAAHTAPPDVQAALDAKLWNVLRPYQAHGVEWLAGLAQQNLHGLLADDMGLGKTLQALGFCAWLRTSGGSHGPSFDGPEQRPALVVCPSTLVTNWLREAARFTPHLRTLDLTGPDRAQRLATRNSYDLLVTSYAILRRDLEHYRADEFSLVILDEAQHIKNRGSQNAQSVKALRARHRLILTGTPLENSVLDLWSLYDFLLPGYLGTAAEFRERYEMPLTREPAPKLMERLRHRIRPFFLRRTKEEVLTELPPKLEFSTLCELTDEQREVYRAVLAQGRREVFDHSGKAGKGRDRIAVLTTLLRLRQVCCHLDLLPQGETKRTWKEPSSKMDRTFELIDEAIDGGHRVLLFSQFVRVLHLLRDEARRRELRFCYLDGQTTERQAEVDRFQDDAGIPLFFISLKAGGTGLNLTGADTVIHFDPWWNPAVEEQATSRAHRMGQSRRVQAYKLIAAGTVEEKIQALQARKRELFQASLAGDEAFVEKLTGDDLEELLAE
jgi:superfamily II DNA or RNA helicase